MSHEKTYLLFDDGIEESEHDVDVGLACFCVLMPPAAFKAHIVLEAEGIGGGHFLDGALDEGLTADEVLEEPPVCPPLGGGPCESFAQHGLRVGVKESQAGLVLALLVSFSCLPLAPLALTASSLFSLFG